MSLYTDNQAKLMPYYEWRALETGILGGKGRVRLVMVRFYLYFLKFYNRREYHTSYPKIRRYCSRHVNPE
jgi:hypothetical protein